MDSRNCGFCDPCAKGNYDDCTSGMHVTIPKGWKLVPIEPTDEMINAYIDSPDMTNWKDDFIIGYKAMLNASPKEPL